MVKKTSDTNNAFVNDLTRTAMVHTSYPDGTETDLSLPTL